MFKVNGRLFERHERLVVIKATYYYNYDYLY